ncbi:MAG: cyclic nucleotide-binding domain-containing protein [Sulfuritalea sp.]|nr:cyclic nucleotide-binding domain-containing protein [Sulfuritalea sp.]
MDVGNTLFTGRADAGTSMHIVLSGRLQVRVGTTTVTNESWPIRNRATPFGEMSMLTDAGRAATVIAVRDTMLGMIDRADIESVVGRHPRAFHNIAKMIIARVTGRRGTQVSKQGTRTVMLAPIHRGVLIAGFACGLRHALLRFWIGTPPNSRKAAQRLGGAAEENYGTHAE